MKQNQWAVEAQRIGRARSSADKLSVWHGNGRGRGHTLDHGEEALIRNEEGKLESIRVNRRIVTWRGEQGPDAGTVKTIDNDGAIRYVANQPKGESRKALPPTGKATPWPSKKPRAVIIERRKIG
jgi:hypothetical protein